MSIAAHTPGGYGGVPQKVGEEFHAADKAEGYFKPKRAVVHRVGNNSKQRTGKSRSWTGK